MNKKTVITGFILTIIIIGVILAIYFGTRKTNDPEKEPIISISSAELAAQSETETETYKMMTEYYDLPELSKGVEIKTTINVKDSYLIKTLKITRTNGSNVDEQNVPISDGDKTISFRPKPNENMAVTHTIKVTYTTLVSDTVKDGPSATIAISEDQLSLASTSKSGDISLTVGNPSLSNNVLFTKNYVTIKLGSIDIFPSQKIYFSPASGNGFKIMGASGNSLNVVNGKIFYILAAGNKNMIATTATETTATQYLTYTNNTLSLSSKTINIQNKLFDITFGSAVPAVEEKAPSKPTLDNGKINWQGSGQTGVDYGGLIWTSVGNAPWDQKYKFRCEKNGKVSEFSGVYGPVSHHNYNNPKIRVSLNGVKPCAGDSDSKLQVFDAKTDTDITSQMKNFGMSSSYDGSESVFVDKRNSPYYKTGSYDCTGDWRSQITKCTNESSCKAIGQHENGCWQKFAGDTWNPSIYATDLGGNSKRMVLQKKTAFKQFYYGDGGCVNESFAKTRCRDGAACTAVGKQSNGCWHTLQNEGPNGEEKDWGTYNTVILRKDM